jgi:hypothetical protein
VSLIDCVRIRHLQACLDDFDRTTACEKVIHRQVFKLLDSMKMKHGDQNHINAYFEYVFQEVYQPRGFCNLRKALHLCFDYYIVTTRDCSKILEKNTLLAI